MFIPSAIYSRMSFVFVTVTPRYSNFSTFSNDEFLWFCTFWCGQCSSSDKALDYGFNLGYRSKWEIFLHSFMFRLVLGFTQPPIK